jgi:hypothetical protein
MSSRRVIAAALLALVAILAAALPAGAPAKKPNQEFFGVIPQEFPNNQDFDRIAEADIRTVRLGFNWAAFQQVEGQCKPEPQVGVCSWTVTDGLLARLAQIGVRVIPTFSGAPPFVQKDPTKPPVKNQDLKRWKAFLESAAARYGRGGIFWDAYEDYGGKALPIKDFQIWNEQNSKQFWSPRPQPRKYAKLVKHSNKALQKGTRKPNVVLGGMFPDAQMPIGPYMREFYRVKKISKSFDEIAVHPYAKSLRDLKRQLGEAHRAARGKTPMRISEIGWSSENGGHPLNVGRSGQAKLLKKGFKLIQRKRGSWKVSGLTWFALRDTNNQATCKFCRGSGLLEVNGDSKPSFRAFKKFSK